MCKLPENHIKFSSSYMLVWYSSWSATAVPLCLFLSFFYFFTFWHAEKKQRLSLLHRVMNNVLIWQVTVMYHLSSYMWHPEMIGVTARSDGFSSIAAACVQQLNCWVGIHLKVALKVKLKGCGAWLFQGYRHINLFCKDRVFKLC